MYKTSKIKEAVRLYKERNLGKAQGSTVDPTMGQDLMGLDLDDGSSGSRETSWWRGEEGWIPDEFQSGVERPDVKLDVTIKDPEYTSQTGIIKKNKSFTENPLDWWRIDPNETQEENTFVEDWFGKNQLTDLMGDTGRMAERSWNGSKSIEDLLQAYNVDKAADLTDDQMASVFKVMEEQSKDGVSDEMLEFQKKVNKKGNSKSFNWVDSLTDGTLAENPSLVWVVP